MKRLSIIAISALTLFSACKKDYLETRPTNAVASASAFTTTSDALLVLNGIHRATYNRETQGDYGQPSMMIYMDMLGEDLVMNAVGNGWYNNEYKWLSHRNENSGLVSYAYRFYYGLLVNANLIIANIDNASGPQAEKNYIKGNALAYRAFCHFNLVQLFGKRYDKATAPNNQLGVPLMLTPTVEPQARETVEKIYTQINADIDAAIPLLTTARPNRSHFNVNVVRGLKARVALTQQNWAVAATEAAAARAGFSLMSNALYLEGFSDGYNSNPEWMWGIDHIDDQSGFFGAFHSYLSCNYNSTNIRTNPKSINRLIYDVLPATDVRSKCWDKTGSTAAIVPPGGIRRPYMTQKFRLLGNPSTTSQGDVPYMRAAEMYLIEAEAKARNNDEAGARTALFTLVSNRNPSYVLSTNTGQALIDEIMLHRRVELWGEGFRFLDLKRLNQPLNRNGSNHTLALANIFDMPAGDKAWEFLIPRAELNANPKVVQNPL
ncbi:MAG: RagB/SusD family nutrient uptake outer membrane protein [Flavihumibacter sp.]|nr:RagB/SusD family nutrient uptake outer membrane protein [Flavihumibacter sp.]